MYLTIHGPNLADQSKGQFHVHTADCRDNARVRYLFSGGGDPWNTHAETLDEIVEAVYADQIAEGADFDSCAADFHFAPCVTLDWRPEN